MANSDLQNSYGPEMAPNSHDFPQAVVSDGLEATHPGQQHGAIAPPYGEQHAKNNQYNPAASEQPHDTGRKKRVAGLPVVAFWGAIVGLVLILAIALGVGLGVGLGQRDSSGGSAATTEATTSASPDSATTSAASTTPATSTASSTTTTTSRTSSATSAAATARNVEICNQASLVTDCTNLTVPVNTCGMSRYPSGSLQVADS
jgi:cytoskeletal protein RodZ